MAELFQLPFLNFNKFSTTTVISLTYYRCNFLKLGLMQIEGQKFCIIFNFCYNRSKNCKRVYLIKEDVFLLDFIIT